MRNASVLTCAIALLTTVGSASAQDWTKSKWGPNDEIGAANYMTPELVMKAAQLVKSGKTYALGIPVDSATPAYPPRGFKITVVQPGQAGSPGLGPTKTTYNDDIIDGWVGVGSQLDGLGHIGVEHVYYNGNKLADFADPKGLKKLGIENVPPMVTRGVLLDMVAHFAGTDKVQDGVVKEGTAFNTKEIEECAKKQGVEIRQGDVVLFNTGWISLIGKSVTTPANPVLASTARNIWSARASLRSAPTTGGSRSFRSKARTSSRCTRFCCR
jgi:hypothetical protein